MARILLVDDEPDVRSTLRRVLERDGHEVLEACDGLEALRIAGETPVELVITDMLMPKMDGIELILAFRSHHSDIPIIAMSGGGQVVPRELVLDNANQLGVVTSLPKPFEVLELRSLVETVLVDRWSRRARSNG